MLRLYAIGQLESCTRDGCDVREAPVLIVRCREAQLGEAGEAVLAQCAQPAQVVAWRALLKAREGIEVTLQFRGCGGQRHRVVTPPRQRLQAQRSPSLRVRAPVPV